MVAGLHRGDNLGGGDPQAPGVDIEPVEFFRGLDQGGVAARRHVIDDGAGGPLDIGRRLALGAEERRKTRVEIGAVFVEANGHGGFLGGVPAAFRLESKAYAQWRDRQWPSTLETRPPPQSKAEPRVWTPAPTPPRKGTARGRGEERRRPA